MADIGVWVVWVGLLPAAYAWAQWLLMRRCLSTAIPWAVAVLVGAFLGRLGQALIGDPHPRLLFGSQMPNPVVMALASVIGANWAMAMLTALPTGLCFGVATSVPQALVLPASKRWRALWIAVILPTEFASTVLGEGLHRSFQLSLIPFSSGSLLWIQLLAIHFVPRLAAWLLIAVASGVLMHIVLRRGAGRVGDQLYARFD